MGAGAGHACEAGRVSARAGRYGWTAAALVGAVVLALALAQVFLPRIAESRISSRVGRYGTVQSVRVSAWPAVRLLWGSADSVKVRAGNLTLSPAQTAKLLWEARGASSMEVTAASVREGPLSLSDVTLRKRGRALTAHARMSDAAVRAALPRGLAVRLLSSEGGRVEVRTSGGLFGARASVDVVAGASGGRLIVRPLGSLLSGLRLTLFSEPHIYVEGVGASVDARRPGYLLRIGVSLR
jgi:LmeA-like phospholipid-binding